MGRAAGEGVFLVRELLAGFKENGCSASAESGAGCVVTAVCAQDPHHGHPLLWQLYLHHDSINF